eukprot:scaffold113425_cov19-Prasinocladus_malaysianus.AAC.1
MIESPLWIVTSRHFLLMREQSSPCVPVLSCVRLAGGRLGCRCGEAHDRADCGGRHPPVGPWLFWHPARPACRCAKDRPAQTHRQQSELIIDNSYVRQGYVEAEWPAYDLPSGPC